MPSVCLTATATTDIYTLSLHDALPISRPLVRLGASGEIPRREGVFSRSPQVPGRTLPPPLSHRAGGSVLRSEEHTSELQSLTNLVCRLLLEKKKNAN